MPQPDAERIVGAPVREAGHLLRDLEHLRLGDRGACQALELLAAEGEACVGEEARVRAGKILGRVHG